MQAESPADEIWLKPSRRLLVMRQAETAAISLLLIALAVIWTLSVSGDWRVVLVPVALLLAVLFEVVAVRRYRAWGYCERSRDLLVRRGVLVRRLTIVPYGRMQLVDVTAGAVERMFGLATIKLHTAAAVTDARIPGLEPAEAARLRDRLAALGEAQAAGV